jgi:Peptidase family S41
MGRPDGSNDRGALGRFLATAQPLTLEERREIVDQALVLIDQLYVHLPLKRAMHAVDPAQRLRLLLRRLESLTERRFHDELIDIFISLRDLHTNYVLPEPFQGAIAVLPFRIEEYWEGGERRYVVSGVARGFDEPPFGVGVDVTHWNGMPIDRAVELNGDRNGGSNIDARHARGLTSMTQRPMALLAPPDEEWVRLTFVAGGETHEAHFDWQILTPPPAPTGVAAGDERLAMALGIDLLTETVRRAQKTVLAPDKMDLERAMAAGAAAPGAPDVAEVSTMPDVLEFRTVADAGGRELGYLRIRTFNVGDVDAFVDEVVRILDLLPQDGLIVDVRGNGGGIIMAGERLLQLFTPRPIEPERLHFINTPLTQELTAIQGLEQWHPSIAESIEIGTSFSDGFPIFPEHPQDCNSVGQCYGGPVVLITDALCYSTTDIFAAGFQDHAIGPILGASGNTGAGGANVWRHEDLVRLLGGPRSPLRPLPRRTSMRVSIRRTTRVGARSGDPLEDLGVVPDAMHRMTRRDVLEHNQDLIAAAAQLLAGRPVRALSFEPAGSSNGSVELMLRTRALDRVDVYVDGRPRGTLDVTDGDHTVTVPTGASIELRGFDAGELAAMRRAGL